MLTKFNKQIIVTAAKADGIAFDLIQNALAVMEQKPPPSETFLPFAVNQATAAKLLSVSRHTIRKLVGARRLHPVQLCGATRYSVSELEKLAGYC